MRKFLLSAFVLGTFTIYAIHLRTDVEEHPVVAIKSPTTPTTDPASTPLTASPTAQPTDIILPTTTPTLAPKGKYRDGTYTGSVADAFYGNIQVKAVISGGKITDVIFLQSPNDRGTSIEINSQAMPLLKQEAIQAQSAQVDGVSGATQSSRAFIESLQSALNQAV